jgi:hypothetical protein
MDQQGQRAVFAEPGPDLSIEGHYFADGSNISEVVERGGRVVSKLPDNQYIVLARAGTPGVIAIDPASKISAEVGTRRFFLVEFFPDTEPGMAESIVAAAGFIIHYRPDLAGVQLLIEGSVADLQGLAANDSVAYIFPAARKLVRGEPVYACLNGATGTAGAGQYIGAYGDGWDGPGRGSAVLTYSYQRLTDKLPADLVKALISRALDEWSKYARVSFSYTDQVTARKNLNILFASATHGDDFPFDGPGRVLAHTFFPNPPNPEPIAGDLHLDADESWQAGIDIDLFSVVLHELGHALGLGHADNPSAVMYPYYRRVTGLAMVDIAAVQTLYAPGSGLPAPAEPLVITVPAPSSTAATNIDLSGTTTGGLGEVRVAWSSDRRGSGIAEGSRAWIARAVPVEIGENSIRLIATDATGTQAAAVVRVIRVPQLRPRDTTAPTITITAPAGTSTSTSQSSFRVSGSANDNVGVTEVRWSTNTGLFGIASGTRAWIADGIPVYRGYNVITIRAFDAAGNMSWRSVGVTKN